MSATFAIRESTKEQMRDAKERGAYLVGGCTKFRGLYNLEACLPMAEKPLYSWRNKAWLTYETMFAYWSELNGPKVRNVT